MSSYSEHQRAVRQAIEDIALEPARVGLTHAKIMRDEIAWLRGALAERVRERIAVSEILESLSRPRPLDEWHEDDGDVLWWLLPVSEPPWVGSPLDNDWPSDYYTHWTPLPKPPEVA